MIGRRVSLWEYEAHVTRPLPNWRNAIWRILGWRNSYIPPLHVARPTAPIQVFLLLCTLTLPVISFPTTIQGENIRCGGCGGTLVHIGGSLQYNNYYYYYIQRNSTGYFCLILCREVHQQVCSNGTSTLHRKDCPMQDSDQHLCPLLRNVAILFHYYRVF